MSVDTTTGEIIEAGLDKIGAALAAFQGTMPTVPKTQTANVKSEKGSYSYTYAGLADVSEAAMPLLAAHGLAFTTLPRDGLLVGMLIHSSGQSLTASLPIHGNTPQQIGSSLTYGRRYLLGCMTGLVTDDDDDGRSAQNSTKKQPRKAAPARPVETSEPEPGRFLRRAAGQADRLARPPVAPPPDAAPPVAPPPESPLLNTTSPLAKAMFAALADIGKHDKPDRLDYVSRVIGRPISTSSEMTDADAADVLAAAQADFDEPFPESTTT